VRSGKLRLAEGDKSCAVRQVNRRPMERGQGMVNMTRRSQHRFGHTMGEVQGAFAQIVESTGGRYNEDHERRLLALKIDNIPVSDIYADRANLTRISMAGTSLRGSLWHGCWCRASFLAGAAGRQDGCCVLGCRRL
jgi:hypothetical protein